MLNVAITFDYELFFGKNLASEDEVIFNPTSKILDLLDKYGVKATFFADVLSVLMNEKVGNYQYVEKFTKQIKDMVQRGHDVQLHIHSNWLKSTYVQDTWQFDTSSYRIHTFGFDNEQEFSVGKIISYGKNYLESTLTKIKSDYKCIAYRAGGYCIQPHEELFNSLIDNGIFIDSSVALMQKAEGVNQYNFVGLDKSVGWWLNANGGLGKEVERSSDCVFEVPIGCFKNSLMRRLISPEIDRGLVIKDLKGTYIGSSTQKNSFKKKDGFFGKLIKFTKGTRMFTLDGVHYKLLSGEISKLSRKNKNKYAYVAVIGHPKLANNTWLDNFEGALKELLTKETVSIVTMLQIADKLC